MTMPALPPIWLKWRNARRGADCGSALRRLSWARHIRLWGHAWRIVQMAGDPALGLIVDSFHTLSLGDDPSGIASVPADRLFFVQMADAPKLSMDVLSWSRHFRSFPGQGDLDVHRFHARGAGHRLYRAAVAGGVQRRVPRRACRLVARDGLRSLILNEAEASGGAGLARTAGARRLSNSWSSRSMKPRGRNWRNS